MEKYLPSSPTESESEDSPERPTTPGGSEYPYLPEQWKEGWKYEYVPLDNPFMTEARRVAKTESSDRKQQTGSVLVNANGEIIGRGANFSPLHAELRAKFERGEIDDERCERVKAGSPTGTGYELCEGCSSKYHSEPTAIRNAEELGNDTHGASLYLWGHWWCCKDCLDAAEAAGIGQVYLVEDSDRLFNKTHPDNLDGSLLKQEVEAPV